MPPIVYSKVPFSGSSSSHSLRAGAKPVSSGRNTVQAHALADLSASSSTASSSAASCSVSSFDSCASSFVGVNRRLAQKLRQKYIVDQQQFLQAGQGRGRGRLSLEAVAAPERAARAAAPSMKTVEVDLGDRSYPIYIGSGLLHQGELLRKHIPGKRALIVTNETIAPLYLEE